MTHLAYEFPLALWLGPLLVIGVLFLLARAQLRRGIRRGRVVALTVLRGMALLTLAFLAARPTWVVSEEPAAERKLVVLLLDRSESMTLEEGGQVRLRQALDFARNDLLPSLKTAGLNAQAFVFADDAQPADGAQLAAAIADGKQTNLAGAIARALQNADKPPLAVIWPG